MCTAVAAGAKEILLALEESQLSDWISSTSVGCLEPESMEVFSHSLKMAGLMTKSQDGKETTTTAAVEEVGKDQWGVIEVIRTQCGKEAVSHVVCERSVAASRFWSGPHLLP